MYHDLLNGLQCITSAQVRALMPVKLPGIYGLADPNEPDVIRYIGSSTHIVKRLADHISSRIKRQPDGVKPVWLTELRAAGRAPIAYVLEVVPTEKASPVMHMAERKWIERFRSVGQSDLNRTLTSQEGELEYLRKQVKKLTQENARLREIQVQQQHEMQRCTNSCVAKSLKLQRNATGALEPVAVLQRIGGLTC
jgi:hypothetical protein